MKNITRIDQEVQRGQKVDGPLRAQTNETDRDSNAERQARPPTPAPDGGLTPPRKPPDPVVPPPEDAFNPERLRLSQDFEGELGLERPLLTVPNRKPDRQWFFRVHPDPQYRIDTPVLEFKQEKETYLVDPALWQEIDAELVAKRIFTCINRQGVIFLWPIRLPGRDGRHDVWNRSALEAARLGLEKWVRVRANMSLGANDVVLATRNLSEPTWPGVPFQEILRISFKNKLITSIDHPALKRLRGEL